MEFIFVERIQFIPNPKNNTHTTYLSFVTLWGEYWIQIETGTIIFWPKN